MTQIQINGSGFDGSNGSSPVDHVTINLSDVDGGVTTQTLNAYDPLGPNSGLTTAGVTVDSWTPTLIEVSHTLFQDKFVASVLLNDDPVVYGVTFDVVPDEPQTVTPVVDPISYNTYYDDNTPGGNPSCANVATWVAVEGVFIYASDLIDGGAAGIQFDLSPAGIVNKRQDLQPSQFLNWDNGSAVIKAITFFGQTVNSAVPIDNTNTPLGTPTPLGFQFYEVVAAGIESGGLDDTLVIDFTDGQPLVPPERVTLIQCTPGASKQYYDPLGPNAGLNPGTATIVQWDVNGIRVVDTTLPAFTLNRLDVENSVGTGYATYGNPVPQVAP